MVDGDENTKWLTLYREAILERDPEKVRKRVSRAQQAIRRRARELWYGRVLDSAERLQMDAASCHLRLLCRIGTAGEPEIDSAVRRS